MNKKQLIPILENYNATLLEITRHGVYTCYYIKSNNGIEMILFSKNKKDDSYISLQIKNVNNQKLIVPKSTNLYKDSMSFTDDNETIKVSLNTLNDVLRCN